MQFWKEGKDLKELYDDRYELNWQKVRVAAKKEGIEPFSDPPISVCEAFRRAHRKNDEIWKFHLQVCDDSIAELE